jgi:hypothetical protein
VYKRQVPAVSGVVNVLAASVAGSVTDSFETARSTIDKSKSDSSGCRQTVVPDLG